MAKRLPPNIGLETTKPLLYGAYQQAFLNAQRQRLCVSCNKIGHIDQGVFTCSVCKVVQPYAKRVFDRLGIFAGRRSGKSIIGSWAARDEMLVPNSLGWVCGPTYKVLHDATMPTLLKLIPREWVSDWDQEHLELTLINGAQVQFRSLDDPDRAHAGVGVHWTWFDEAAFISELAWDYFEPALTDHAGVAFFTSSVDGYDWTYDRIEKPALIDHVPGFWACKCRTIDNPFMKLYRSEEIERARRTKPPQIFRQEYEGERENFTGAVYGEWIDECWLPDDQSIQTFIPEWPEIDPSRRVLIGLDSGADHPFGAAKLVVTEKGIVVVGEYLERQRAISSHLAAIVGSFRPLGNNPMWTANRNEAQLRLEFAAHGILVAPAEANQEAGIQRVLSWLYTQQLKVAYTCPKTFEQMKKLRYAENVQPDGQKKEKEKVFKKEDELPDAIRYALMTWPSLPKTPDAKQGRDLAGLKDQRMADEIARMKLYLKKEDPRDLQPMSEGYPSGDFWGMDGDDDGRGGNSYVGWESGT